MIPKPVEQIKAPDRANLCNGEGYISPTETAALNNVFREAYRAPAPAPRDRMPTSPTHYASAKPLPPRVNTASTVQLEQELARRKAEERKKKEVEGAAEYKEGKKKARQMNIVVTTLCSMVGLEFVGNMKFKVKATGDVFGEEAFNTAQKK